MADTKPRLLIVGVSWPLETFLSRLFEGLAARDVRLTFASKSRPDPSWLKQNQATWIPLWRARFGGPWDVIYFPWNSAAVENLPIFDLGIPAVVSCRGAQVNIAPHNPERFAILEGLKQTFQKAALIHCVCEAIQREAAKYGLEPQKGVVINPSVDADFFSPVEFSRKEDSILRIVSTGALIWRKGYEYALLAIRRLIDETIQVRYEIIGDGPERQRILYTIQDLGLEKQVVLRGRLKPGDVRKALCGADVFLLSSLSEGISNAVLEAMACGLPIVTADCGGMREAVTDGVEGFVVPVRDPEAMAEKIGFLNQNQKLREKMGHSARHKVLQQFTIEKQVGQFMELFEGIRKKRLCAA